MSQLGTYISMPYAVAGVCRRHAKADSAGSRLWLKHTDAIASLFQPVNGIRRENRYAVYESPGDPGSRGLFGMFTSASPSCLDDRDIDFLHRHHRLEGTFGLAAAGRKRIG